MNYAVNIMWNNVRVLSGQMTSAMAHRIIADLKDDFVSVTPQSSAPTLEDLLNMVPYSDVLRGTVSDGTCAENRTGIAEWSVVRVEHNL